MLNLVVHKSTSSTGGLTRADQINATLPSLCAHGLGHCGNVVEPPLPVRKIMLTVKLVVAIAVLAIALYVLGEGLEGSVVEQGRRCRGCSVRHPARALRASLALVRAHFHLELPFHRLSSPLAPREKTSTPTHPKAAARLGPVPPRPGRTLGLYPPRSPTHPSSFLRARPRTAGFASSKCLLAILGSLHVPPRQPPGACCCRGALPWLARRFFYLPRRWQPRSPHSPFAAFRAGKKV